MTTPITSPDILYAHSEDAHDYNIDVDNLLPSSRTVQSVQLLNDDLTISVPSISSTGRVISFDISGAQDNVEYRIQVKITDSTSKIWNRICILRGSDK